jgi:hypothetical protein
MEAAQLLIRRWTGIGFQWLTFSPMTPMAGYRHTLEGKPAQLLTRTERHVATALRYIEPAT